MMIQFEVRVHSPDWAVRRRVKQIAEHFINEVLGEKHIFGFNIDWDPPEHSRSAPFSRITGKIYTSDRLEDEVTTTFDIKRGKVLVWLVPLE